MSQRSLLEFNHDKIPSDFDACVTWADKLLNHLRSGDCKDLPDGVASLWSRHHSEPCPVEACGENQDKLDNCRMLIQRLAKRLAKSEAKGDADLAAKALDYIKRAGLTGSILRKAESQ